MVFLAFDWLMNSEARSAIFANGPISVLVVHSETISSVDMLEVALNLDTLPLSQVKMRLSIATRQQHIAPSVQ